MAFCVASRFSLHNAFPLFFCGCFPRSPPARGARRELENLFAAFLPRETARSICRGMPDFRSDVNRRARR